MGLSAQKVVDVYSYLGDASAAGADEIGKAMQKVASSAQEAGLSIEWIGSYIATVSEKTRQSPETIGRSFNSIISRIQNIKAKGYSEEDGTQINDVAKALSNIGVELLDDQDEWRELNAIFDDIARQWDTLNAKTRSYIATTIAGTNQKNVFLTLMEDMSKAYDGTEETSRAMKLYEGALNSAGNAAQKYAIYQDSVTAAQDRMNAAFEKWYSLLSGTIIKDFYNGVGDVFGRAYNMMFGSEYYDYSSVISSVQGQVDFISPLVDEYTKLNDVKDRTEAQDQRMAAIVETLAGKNRELKTALTDSNGEFLSGQAAVDAMTQALIGYQEQLDKLSLRQVKEKIEEARDAIQDAQEDVKKANLDESIVSAIDKLGTQMYGKDFSRSNKEQLKRVFQGIEHFSMDEIDNIRAHGTTYDEDDWRSELYSGLFPDGEYDSELASSWMDFFKNYEDLVNTVFTKSISTADEASKSLESAYQQLGERVVQALSMSNNSDLAEVLNIDMAELAKDALETFKTEHDLSDPKSESEYEQAVQEAYEKRVEAITRAYDAAKTYVENYQNAKNDEDTSEEEVARLKNLAQDAVVALNSTVGTQWTFEDFIKWVTGDQSVIDAALHQAEDSVNTLTGITADAEAAQSQIQKFYENAKKNQEKTKIKARSDAGWKDEQQGWIDT